MTHISLKVLNPINEDSPCTFRAVADRRVRFVWEITARCNLSCWYCFRTDPSTTGTDRAFITTIAAQFDAATTDSVLLTGGEPFLLPDFPGLVAGLVGRDIHVKVATNLTFASKVLRDVEDIRRIDISTSIDGCDPASHDSIRGTGSVRRIRENVAFLRDLGRSVSARCVLTQQNIRGAEQTVTMARDIGFSSLTFSRLTKVPDRSTLKIDDGYDNAVPSEESVGPFLELVAGLRAKYQDFPIRTAGFTQSTTNCSAAGTSLVYITSNGIVHPCTLYRVDDPRLDLRRNSLRSALETLASLDRGDGRSTCPSLIVGGVHNARR